MKCFGATVKCFRATVKLFRAHLETFRAEENAERPLEERGQGEEPATALERENRRPKELIAQIPTESSPGSFRILPRPRATH